MELNEIKKLLYKKNPKANIIQITKEFLNYTARIDDLVIRFLVPISDIGDASFFQKWMQNF